MEQKAPPSESTAAATVLAMAFLSVRLASPVPAALWAAFTMAALLGREGRFSLPNAVTLGRLWLLAGALLVSWRQPQLVLPIALGAWLLDGLDGALARWRNQATPFGARFDLETDAHLVQLVCLELVVSRGFPLWVLLAGALRYLLVMARTLATKPIVERRSTWGRLTFSFSYLSLCAGLWPALDPASAVLVPLAVLALLISFAPDFLAVARARG